MQCRVFFLFLPLFFQSLFSNPSNYFEEIEDQANLPLLNPDFAKRQTLKLRLQNGLELLIISDPNADQSGASVSVEAGSWSDPEEYPGMAHFCEHMLFMGTEKYPSENEFFQEISNFGGMANAFTAPHRTVYMFSCQEAGFLSLLDRFGHFFIDPLFNPDNISREMHAVDQEFAKSLESDLWRSYMVWKETGNPNHPNRLFSCGNSQTLSNIPQSVLKKWHRQHYGANQMHVAIYSSLPLNLLKEKAALLFSEVPTSKPTRLDPKEPLASSEQIGHIIYLEPIQNRQQLTLSWELPPDFASESSHASDLIAYALMRGQKKNLYELLKKERLIDAMTIHVDDAGGKEHRFLQMTFELTDAGLSQVETVGLRAFQALTLLKTSGLPLYLFQEMNQVKELSYSYQSRQDAFTTIRSLGETLGDEPLSTYPRRQLLGENYSPELLQSVLSLLTPENCAATLLAPKEKTKVVYDKKEAWMGVEYTVKPLPKNWLSSWKKASAHPEIALPSPNPFIPSRLNIASFETSDPNPMLLAKGELGTAFYARAPEYEVPEASIHLHILSSEIRPTAKSQVLSSIYLDHLTDLLHWALQAAESAGLKTSFRLDRSRLYLSLYGFSEKAPVLLQEILKQMPLDPPSFEEFSVYFDRHKKAYLNAQKEIGFKQGKELLDALINQDKTTSEEKLEALEKITYEEFLTFHKNLFEKTYIEALFAGNLSIKEAESSWLDILHALGKTPLTDGEKAKTKIVRLPEKEGPFLITKPISALGNAAFLLLDEGAFTFEARASQEILAAALKEAFFSELRTKQKTGYIAASDGSEIEGRLFQIFFVQSNSHQPEDLLYRFELFLENYLQDFGENIPVDRFDMLKKTIIHSLKTRCRNLKEKSLVWDKLAFEEGADFGFIEKRIEGIENLSYEDFVQFGKGALARKNRKRLAVLVPGKLSSPFAYAPLTLNELEEIAEYAPKFELEAEGPRL